MPALEKSLLKTIFEEVDRSFEEYNVFIETGTFMGETSYMASQIFKNVYTIEVYEPLYVEACKKFENTNVKVFLGDSLDVLPSLLTEIEGNAFFWLDGHNSGAGTGIGKIDPPLVGECEIINQHFKGKEALVLIDDIRIYNSLHTSAYKAFSKRSVVYQAVYGSSESQHDRLLLHVK